MLSEFLLSAAADALGGLAGSAAIGAYKSARLESSGPWSLPDVGGPFRAFLTRELRDAELSQRDSVAASKFCTSAEGQVLARFVALDVLATRTVDLTTELIAYGRALLILCPATKAANIDLIAPVLVRSLQIVISASVKQLRRTDKEWANRLSEIATRERQANPNLHLDAATNEVRDLRNFDATSLLENLRAYAKAVAHKHSMLGVPSLHEERRVPFDELFVEPTVDSGSIILDDSASDDGTSLTRLLGVTPRVVVLGEPGGGKTTLLRATIRELATRFLLDERSAVPVHLSLARYWRQKAGSADFNLTTYMALIMSENLLDMNRNALRYLLSSGRVVVFLDGLDEILNVADRAEVRDEIEALVGRFRASAFVVSSREVGYGEAPLTYGGFPRVRILPFNSKKVKEFVEKFYVLSEQGHADSSSTMTARFMVDTARIRSVRSNPLMLGLLCILYESGRTIPSNRSELYRSCAEMLLSRWDARRGIEVMVDNADAAEDAVGNIAAQIFELGEDEVSESWLRHRLEQFYLEERSTSPAAARQFAENILRLWRGRRWLLIDAGLRGGEQYFRFSHRTFLEYFAALQITFTRGTAADVWEAIAEYVRQRSAAVFCQLIAEMFTRKSQTNGDQFLQLVGDDLSSLMARARWNVVAFIGEILPLVRAATARKLWLVRFVTDTVVSLQPTYGAYPLPNEVYDGLFYGTNALADGFGPESLETNQREFDLNFSQITEPLQSFVRASPVTRDLIFGEIADRLLTLRSDPNLAVRAFRVSIELPLYTYLEDWEAVDSERVNAFFVRAETIREAALRSEFALAVAGQDYWLDVYLARFGVMPFLDLQRARGSEAFWLGGWGLPVVGAPPTGTVMHKLLQYVFDSLTVDPSTCSELLEAVYAGQLTLLMGAFGGSAGRSRGPRYDFELFSKSPVRLNERSSQVELSSLTTRARTSLFVLCAGLAMHGDLAFLEPLEHAASGTLTRDLYDVLKHRDADLDDFVNKLFSDVPNAALQVSDLFSVLELLGRYPN